MAALWSCSGKASASLSGQDVVASLLSLSFAWLNDCANGDEADFTCVQTQKRKVTIVSMWNIVLSSLAECYLQCCIHSVKRCMALLHRQNMLFLFSLPKNQVNSTFCPICVTHQEFLSPEKSRKIAEIVKKKGFVGKFHSWWHS